MNSTQKKMAPRQSRTLVTELLIAIAILAAVIIVPIFSSLAKSKAEQTRSNDLAALNQLSDELSEAISHHAITRASGHTMTASAGKPSTKSDEYTTLAKKRGEDRVET